MRRSPGARPRRAWPKIALGVLLLAVSLLAAGRLVVWALGVLFPPRLDEPWDKIAAAYQAAQPWDSLEEGAVARQVWLAGGIYPTA